MCRRNLRVYSSTSVQNLLISVHLYELEGTGYFSPGTEDQFCVFWLLFLCLFCQHHTKQPVLVIKGTLAAQHSTCCQGCFELPTGGSGSATNHKPGMMARDSGGMTGSWNRDREGKILEQGQGAERKTNKMGIGIWNWAGLVAVVVSKS